MKALRALRRSHESVYLEATEASGFFLKKTHLVPMPEKASGIVEPLYG